MAFATDAQRRWFFAHLATGMRRIAGKMRESAGVLSQAQRDALATAKMRVKEEQGAIEKTKAGGFDRKVAERELQHQQKLVGKLTRAQAVENLMAGTSSGVELSKKRKQNAARRARYQLMKDLYGHRTRSGGWE